MANVLASAIGNETEAVARSAGRPIPLPEMRHAGGGLPGRGALGSWIPVSGGGAGGTASPGRLMPVWAMPIFAVQRLCLVPQIRHITTIAERGGNP